MTESPTPLLPVTDLAAGFWSAVASHELVRPVCRACRRSFFGPQIACPYCLSERWDYLPSDGRGTVYSSTVVHRAPSPGFPVPFRLGVVDLEAEGWTMLTNFVGGPCDRCPAIGSRVRVTWIERDGLTLPAFTEVAS